MLNRIIRNWSVGSFNHVNKWSMFSWVISDTKQYLKPVNCVQIND